jgi:hypothetical protein
MARPQRNNIDYFPHECVHGRKMFVIESKYGNDGYAVWFKLLERLGDTDNHYLNLSDETELMYLASLMKVDEIKFKNILSDLSKLGAIDKELYEENKIVWSQKFYESIQDAYAKRNNRCIDRNSLVQLLISLGIRKQGKSSNKPIKGDQYSDINPQSKEEEIKEKKTMFHVTLKPFLEKYGKDMLNDFFLHWTQESKTGKLGFELEKTWSVEARLNTWSKRVFNQKPQTPQQTNVSPPSQYKKHEN